MEHLWNAHFWIANLINWTKYWKKNVLFFKVFVYCKKMLEFLRIKECCRRSKSRFSYLIENWHTHLIVSTLFAVNSKTEKWLPRSHHIAILLPFFIFSDIMIAILFVMDFFLSEIIFYRVRIFIKIIFLFQIEFIFQIKW